MIIIILRYQLKDLDERCFLAPSLDFFVGSSSDCELVLDDPLVEPRHARFFYLLGTWWVEPENHSALIRCRGERIREAVPLVPDLPIQLGSLHVRPEFTPRFQDASEPEGEIVASTYEVAAQPLGLAEGERLRILLSIRKALANQKGRALFDALSIAMFDLFPSASSTAILSHHDNELLPLASWPDGPVPVSFTLARRAAYAFRGFVWERSLASPASQQIASLKSVITSLYCPVVLRRHLYGVIAVNAERLDRPLNGLDLTIAGELCRVVAGSFKEFAEGSRAGITSTFISYSRSNREAASRVADFLRRHGISVWMDDRLHAGEDWRQQIESVIQAVDSMTVLLSPTSLKSEVVAWETNLARKNGKPLLPVMIAEVGELPEEWGRVHYLDLRGDSSIQLLVLSHQLTSLADAARTNDV